MDGPNLRSRLTPTDLAIAEFYLGSADREPDLDIRPDGDAEYLYRWYLTPRGPHGNVYLHLQVADDPERPLHDHPWDNQSVILAGGYDEVTCVNPPYGRVEIRKVRAGDTIHRKAEWSHRLILPKGFPYTMTLFTTGATRRDWGFWINNHRGRPDWVSHQECIVIDPDTGRSIFKGPTR